MAKQHRVGGSFAPSIKADDIAKYRAAAQAHGDQEVSEAILELIEMVELFQQTPDSTLPGTPHPSGTGVVTPLTDEEKKRIFDKVPWKRECDALAVLFNALPDGTVPDGTEERIAPNGKPYKVEKRRVVDEHAATIRKAAFHLLWYAYELTFDREPMTRERVGI